MNSTELFGWIASALVLAANLCRHRFSALRWAIGANVAFIIYASQSGVHSVLALHLALLPLNGLKLHGMHATPALGLLAAAFRCLQQLATRWQVTAPAWKMKVARIQTASSAMARRGFAMAALLALVGCGGGGDDEAPVQSVQPVDCHSQPLRCV